MTADLELNEQAQKGLQYIEDAVVALLTRRAEGMTPSAVADALGLETRLDHGHRDMIAAGILALLVANGRVIWDGAIGRYVDNPSRG
jgi:hypothetical protein